MGRRQNNTQFDRKGDHLMRTPMHTLIHDASTFSEISIESLDEFKSVGGP